MDNTKELYYKIAYIKFRKNGGGAIKIEVDFNKNYMRYDETDAGTGDMEKSIFLREYDYNLACEVLCTAYNYRSQWLYAKFF